MNKRSESQVLLYRAPDGRTRLEVRMQDETVWLTQTQMAELFQTTVANVNIHLGKEGHFPYSYESEACQRTAYSMQ